MKFLYLKNNNYDDDWQWQQTLHLSAFTTRNMSNWEIGKFSTKRTSTSFSLWLLYGNSLHCSSMFKPQFPLESPYIASVNRERACCFSSLLGEGWTICHFSASSGSKGLEINNLNVRRYIHVSNDSWLSLQIFTTGPKTQGLLTFESITDSQCKHWKHLVQCYYYIWGYRGEWGKGMSILKASTVYQAENWSSKHSSRSLNLYSKCSWQTRYKREKKYRINKETLFPIILIN